MNFLAFCILGLIAVQTSTAWPDIDEYATSPGSPFPLNETTWSVNLIASNWRSCDYNPCSVLEWHFKRTDCQAGKIVKYVARFANDPYDIGSGPNTNQGTPLQTPANPACLGGDRVVFQTGSPAEGFTNKEYACKPYPGILQGTTWNLFWLPSSNDQQAVVRVEYDGVDDEPGQTGVKVLLQTYCINDLTFTTSTPESTTSDCIGPVPTSGIPEPRCWGAWSCCMPDNKCNIGDGDCHGNNDKCFSGKCGKDNCPLYNGGSNGFQINDDCCVEDDNYACFGGDTCCHDDHVCGLGEGDCDNDSHCSGNLVCGRNNCVGPYFDSADDCCTQP